MSIYQRASELREAVLAGNEAQVRACLVEHRVDPNYVPYSADRTVALHVAAARGNYNIASLLLDHRASVYANDANNQTALHHAAANSARNVDAPRLIELLLERRAHLGAFDSMRRTALHYAVQRGSVQAVESLLDRHASVNLAGGFEQNSTPLHEAMQHNQLQVCDLLLSRSGNLAGTDTPIGLAVSLNNLPLLDMVVRHGAKVNDRAAFQTLLPIHRATASGNAAIVSRLIELRADLDAETLGIPRFHPDTKYLGWAFAPKSTPILEAIGTQSIEVLEVLLRHRASLEPHGGPNALPPLIYATVVGSFEIVNLLLDHLADVNGTLQPRNLTALHVAARINEPEIARLLVERGANKAIRTLVGITSHLLIVGKLAS